MFIGKYYRQESQHTCRPDYRDQPIHCPYSIASFLVKSRTKEDPAKTGTIASNSSSELPRCLAACYTLESRVEMRLRSERILRYGAPACSRWSLHSRYQSQSIANWCIALCSSRNAV